MATTRTARQASIRMMAQLAILTAILLIFAFTPLGYLRIGIVSISFMALPVAIGAMIGGLRYGLILGTIFGVTSFAQCFGMDAFGTTLMGINPIATFVMCVVSRALMGACAGLICDLLKRIDRTHVFAYAATGVAAALLNTVFFVGALVLFFGSDQAVQELMGVDSVVGIILALVTFNAAIEAAVCLIAGTAVGKVLDQVIKPSK